MNRPQNNPNVKQNMSGDLVSHLKDNPSPITVTEWYKFDCKKMTITSVPFNIPQNCTSPVNASTHSAKHDAWLETYQ